MPADNIGTELKTIREVAGIFCSGRHGRKGVLCPDCAGLLAYAEARLKACPRRPRPACGNCPAPCYTAGMRARMIDVMRYAGPRMCILHPLLSLKHYFRRRAKDPGPGVF